MYDFQGKTLLHADFGGGELEIYEEQLSAPIAFLSVHDFWFWRECVKQKPFGNSSSQSRLDETLGKEEKKKWHLTTIG